ncbi:MAG TPA: oligosaccharide flippase family protein, partial [Rhodopila sp.]
MLRQIIGYVPSTVVPAVVSFVMIYCYTRLLTPSAYGDFSLVFSAVQVVQTVFFYAIPVALTRFYPAALAQQRQDDFLTECYILFYLLSVFVIALIGVVTFSPIAISPVLWVLAILLMIARSAVVLNQAVNRITFKVARFSVIECTHAVLGLGLGLLFIYVLGSSATSVVLGLSVAALICMLLDARPLTLPFRADRTKISRDNIAQLVKFALPLLVVDLTVCILQLSDRFLLDTLGGAEALGIYFVAYNLVERPISLVCTAISTATFPVAVQVLQDHGLSTGGRQAGKNGVILLAVALPACVGLALTAPYIATAMIGANFRAGVAALIPIMCVTALCRGLSTHFIDHIFHLTGRTVLALRIYGPAAVANIGLNLVLIPRYGMFGAAWAGVACQAAALVAGWIIGRRAFPIRLPLLDPVKIVTAALLMGLTLFFV